MTLSQTRPPATHRTALILGANGGLGRACTHQLLARGWHVRAWVRRPPAPGTWRAHPALEIVVGDVGQAADVRAAAHGCAAVIHAVNPPRYQGWERYCLPWLEHSIAAARAADARLVLPGNVYVYDPTLSTAREGLDEAAACQPRSRKGAIRVALESRLRQAADQGVRSLVLRCGDFFGPEPGGNWLSQAILQPGRPVRRLIWPGQPGVGHAWAYLPDVAATLGALLEQDARLGRHETLQFGGHWDADGTRMLTTLRQVVANQTGRAPRVWPLPWPLIRLASPVSPFMAELSELRDLWRYPLRLDDRRLRQWLGDVPHTPWTQAITATLSGLGCLPAHDAAPALG